MVAAVVGVLILVQKFLNKMPLIDTHAHIYSDEFNTDRADMIHRSRESGVDKIYMPNVDHTSIDGMLELELKYPAFLYSDDGFASLLC